MSAGGADLRAVSEREGGMTDPIMSAAAALENRLIREPWFAKALQGCGCLPHGDEHISEDGMTDTLTTEQLSGMKALLTSAMQGDDQNGNKWWMDKADNQPWGVAKGPGGYRSSAPVCSSANFEDAELIVALRNAAPALIAMAERCAELSDQLFELRDNIDHPAEGCTCRFHPRTHDPVHECMHHRLTRERAEKAESESTRYREMAVRLAEAMHQLVYEDNSDEYLVVWEAREVLEDPDIAALLTEGKDNG